MSRKPTVLLISTMDTKHQEVEFVMTCLKEADVDVYTVDAGIMGESPIPVSVSREEVAQLGGETLSKVQNMGHEGRAMDEMIEHERPFAVVDLSLHEIIDHLFSGDYDAGADQRKAALSAGIPTVLVPGNADFLVTGPLEEAGTGFPGRAYHMHNAAITARSASDEEMTLVQRNKRRLSPTGSHGRIFGF